MVDFVLVCTTNGDFPVARNWRSTLVSQEDTRWRMWPLPPASFHPALTLHPFPKQRDRSIANTTPDQACRITGFSVLWSKVKRADTLPAWKFKHAVWPRRSWVRKPLVLDPHAVTWDWMLFKACKVGNLCKTGVATKLTAAPLANMSFFPFDMGSLWMLLASPFAFSRRSVSSLTCFAAFLMVLILDPKILGRITTCPGTLAARSASVNSFRAWEGREEITANSALFLDSSSPKFSASVFQALAISKHVDWRLQYQDRSSKYIRWRVLPNSGESGNRCLIRSRASTRQHMSPRGLAGSPCGRLLMRSTQKLLQECLICKIRFWPIQAADQALTTCFGIPSLSAEAVAWTLWSLSNAFVKSAIPKYLSAGRIWAIGKPLAWSDWVRCNSQRGSVSAVCVPLLGIPPWTSEPARCRILFCSCWTRTADHTR